MFFMRHFLFPSCSLPDLCLYLSLSLFNISLKDGMHTHEDRVCGVTLNQNVKIERHLKYSDPGPYVQKAWAWNRNNTIEIKARKERKKKKEKSGFRTTGPVDNFYCLTRLCRIWPMLWHIKIKKEQLNKGRKERESH